MSKASYETAQLPIELIDENPDNKDIYGMEKLNELINAINEDGFTDPIGVYDMENGRYEVFSGHKRLLAEKQRNQKTISCLIFKKPDNDIERARRLIRSNFINRDTNPLTRAKELDYYFENVIIPQNNTKYKSKHLQLAQEFGISTAQVSKYMALLKLIPELQELTKDSSFPYSALSSAARLSEDKQKLLYKKIIYQRDEEGNIRVTRDDINSYINALKNDIDERPAIKMMQYTSNNMEPLSINPIFPPSGLETVPIEPKAPIINRTSDNIVDNSYNIQAVPIVPKVPIVNKISDNSFKELNNTEHVQVKNISIDYTLFHATHELNKVSSMDYIIEDKNSVRNNILQLQKIISDIQSKL